MVVTPSESAPFLGRRAPDFDAALIHQASVNRRAILNNDLDRLARLGIPVILGTDRAWSFRRGNVARHHSIIISVAPLSRRTTGAPGRCGTRGPVPAGE